MSKRLDTIEDVGKRLPVSLAKKLVKVHKANKHANRGWGYTNDLIASTPFEFDYSAYDSKNYDSTWQMNIDLHQAMNDHWAIVMEDRAAAEQFIAWVIKGWGRIRGNSDERMEGFYDSMLRYGFIKGETNIASYSKVMSAVNYTKYFILDARAAASLHVLQMDFHAGKKWFFPVTGTQNIAVKEYFKIYNWTAMQEVFYFKAKKGTYDAYCELIRRMGDYLYPTQPERRIEVEMMLFDNADHLVADLDGLAEQYQRNVAYQVKREADTKQRKIARANERFKEHGKL